MRYEKDWQRLEKGYTAFNGYRPCTADDGTVTWRKLDESDFPAIEALLTGTGEIPKGLEKEDLMFYITEKLHYWKLALE
jgi:hypothetical protein